MFKTSFWEFQIIFEGYAETNLEKKYLLAKYIFFGHFYLKEMKANSNNPYSPTVRQAGET